LRWAAALIVALLIGLFARPASAADGVELRQLSTHRTEDGMELSFSTFFDLPRAAADAVMNGVPIYFVAEASVFRQRWYWRDNRVAHQTRSWRLSRQPLTSKFVVNTGGLNQSYETLAEALASLRGVTGWHIADTRELEGDGSYYMEFSYKLDISQLPRLIDLGTAQGFGLSIERSLALMPDFSVRSIIQ